MQVFILKDKITINTKLFEKLLSDFPYQEGSWVLKIKKKHIGSPQNTLKRLFRNLREKYRKIFYQILFQKVFSNEEYTPML